MSCHLTIILHFVKNLINCNFLNKGGLLKLHCFGSIESISTPHLGHITDCFKQLLYMAIIVCPNKILPFLTTTPFYLHSRVLHYYPILLHSCLTLIHTPKSHTTQLFSDNTSNFIDFYIIIVYVRSPS